MVASCRIAQVNGPKLKQMTVLATGFVSPGSLLQKALDSSPMGSRVKAMTFTATYHPSLLCYSHPTEWQSVKRPELRIISRNDPRNTVPKAND